MRAGLRDERILIQEPIERANVYGEKEITWVKVEEIWANVSPEKGREWFAAQQINNSNPVQFTINYRKNMSDRFRVIHDCREFEIKNSTGFRKRNEHRLMCSEIT